MNPLEGYLKTGYNQNYFQEPLYCNKGKLMKHFLCMEKLTNKKYVFENGGYNEN